MRWGLRGKDVRISREFTLSRIQRDRQGQCFHRLTKRVECIGCFRAGEEAGALTLWMLMTGFPLHSCEFRNRFIRGALPLTHGVVKFFAEVCKVSVLRRTRILLFVAPAALLLPVAAARAGSAQDEAAQHTKTTTSSTASKTTTKSASKGTSSKTGSTAKASTPKTSSSKNGAHAHTVSSKGTHKKHHQLSAHSKAQSVKLKRAFTESSQLRPMAQQLTQMRTPAAYSGITAWAHAVSYTHLR